MMFFKNLSAKLGKRWRTENFINIWTKKFVGYTTKIAFEIGLMLLETIKKQKQHTLNYWKCMQNEGEFSLYINETFNLFA